jgi:O-antigen/teichoic acid export membrane protein
MKEASSILSRMRRGALEAFVLHVLGVGLLFLMHTVLARFLGSGEYGIYSYAHTITTLLAVFVPLGWPSALMRFIAQYQEEQSWGLLRGALMRAHQITLIVALGVALLLWVTATVLPLAGEVRTSLQYAALLLPVLSFVGLRRKALQAIQKVMASIAFEEILLPLLVLLICVTCTVRTAPQALWSHWSAAVAVFAAASWWLWRHLGEEARRAQPEYETTHWMRVALPMMFGGITQIILNRADVLILGAMVDMKAVGIYSAAQRLAGLNTFVLGAINTMAAPMFAAAYHGNRHEQFRLVMAKAMVWSTVGSLPLFLFMLLWPQALLRFFGAEFSAGAHLLQILALGQMVNAVTGPVGFNLLMSGKERQFAYTLAVVATVNVLANVVIIPRFGTLGAAWVAAISVGLLNAWQLFLTGFLQKHKACNSKNSC